MDLKVGSARATDVERAAVDALLGPAPAASQGGARDAADHFLARGGAALREMRHLLLPTLHAVNDHVGWISRGAINYIAERLDVAPAEIYGVATFYALFSMDERPARQVHVCVDLACRAAGGLAEHDLPPGTHPSPCLGACERAPAALAIESGDPQRRALFAPATPVEVRRIAEGAWPEAEAPVIAAVPQVADDDQSLVLLRRVGRVDPTSLDDYRATGGYEALRRSFAIGPTEVIREVTDSGLVGRGGAAFPTGRKWDAVARQPARPHHLVCNADESEPGTFKDRVLIEGDPFALIESMTIAAFATGCAHGWVYLRGEYPRALDTLEAALVAARARGYLGDDILGSGFAFDITMFRGAGAYICGEETAIFNSVEGFRGEPRNKPPFPVEVGLFGKPTLVNNVETLVNVVPIVAGGGPAYSALGTEGSKGRKLFCVSGAVDRPGVFEVEFGATLRELLDLAGGMRGGARLQAILLGGAAGGFVGPDDLDLPLTMEAARTAGTTLGSGVVLVLDDSVDLIDQLRRIAAFFRDESCGQCVPCRVGTVRQEEVLARLASTPREGDLELFRELAQVMRDASICGLGQTAPSAIESAIERLGVFQ
ncbi:MAG TPA: NADH-ubiquinone oxidoreductase-F iron-sulfur binding region domain-containing protein [Ilumatobacteraceae bacterium]|nr:NADH-ubiquinone oxidoreductase-F iron-sulfur binding region domain-containing protein [Ilumatobacteraceae bacterium]